MVGRRRRPGEPRLSLSLLPLAQFLALPYRQRGHLLALMPPPCRCARHHATHPTAGPNQLERQEAPPGIVAVNNGARDEVARHCCGVEPLAAECAGEPDAGLDFADLRHAVNGKSHLGRPEMLELYGPELWICGAKRALKPFADPLRTWP